MGDANRVTLMDQQNARNYQQLVCFSSLRKRQCFVLVIHLPSRRLYNIQDMNIRIFSSFPMTNNDPEEDFSISYALIPSGLDGSIQP